MKLTYSRCCSIFCHNNTFDKKRLYCSNHECQIENCYNENISSDLNENYHSQYCKKCVCGVNLCDKSKFKCFIHRCSNSTCHKKKIPSQYMEFDQYCPKHVCLGIKCIDACLDKYDYCLICWIKNDYIKNNEPNYLQKLPWELLDIILDKCLI